MAITDDNGAKPNNDASVIQNADGKGTQGALDKGTLLDGDAPDDKGGKPDDQTPEQKAEAAKAAEAKAAEVTGLETAVTEAKKALEADPENKELQDAVKAAEDKLNAAKPKVDGAPDKYEFKAADGQEFDPELTTEFSTVAKELNLSQEKADKLVAFGPKILQKALAKQVEQWATIREGWVNELKADKEFGGPQLAETVNRAKRALAKFGDAGLTKLLSAPNKGGTGFGDNNSLIKFLARVDKATSEDQIVDGDPSGKDNVSAAEVIYPTQGKA